MAFDPFGGPPGAKGSPEWNQWHREFENWIQGQARSGAASNLDQLGFQNKPEHGAALYGQYTPEWFQAQRQGALQSDLRAGHITPIGNMYYNPGKAGGDDPSKWQWFDSNYSPIGAPTPETLQSLGLNPGGGAGGAGVVPGMGLNEIASSIAFQNLVKGAAPGLLDTFKNLGPTPGRFLDNPGNIGDLLALGAGDTPFGQTTGGFLFGDIDPITARGRQTINNIYPNTRQIVQEALGGGGGGLPPTVAEWISGLDRNKKPPRGPGGDRPRRPIEA